MRPRILFVDDEPSVHFPMREYFGALGYLVDCASGVGLALAQLELGHYDVVIADLRLGSPRASGEELEGLDLVEHVRRVRPGTRIVVLTACRAELAEEALRRGADSFLQKPQPLDRVAAVIASLTQGAR